MKRYIIYSLASFLLLAIVSLSGCKKDDDTPPPPPAPVANFTFSGAGNNAPCEVTFTNTSTNATSYSWDFGDGSTSTDKNPKHTYTSGGTFTVQLTAKGDGGSNSITKTINISDPIGPIANFTFSGASGFAPCTVTFTNTSTDATSYSWDFGDGSSTSTAENPSHTYNTGGVFSVTLTATSSVGTNSITKNVNIDNPPTKVSIDKVVIIDYPQTNSSGGGWDNYNGPDIFWKLLDANGNELFESGVLNDAIYSNLPFTFTNGLPYTITNLNQEYEFDFWDYDFPDADDFMDYSLFYPNDYTDYPSIVHIVWDDPAYIDFDIYLTWSNSKKSFNTNKEITINLSSKK